MDGNGSIPDFDSLIAEEFRPCYETSLSHHGQADELPGDALHTGSDIGNDRGVDEPVAKEKDPWKVRHQPDTEASIRQGGKHIDAN